MLKDQTLALKSTGERVTVLYEFTAGPIVDEWKSGSPTRRDTINDKGKVIKEDEPLRLIGGSRYVSVMLPPQSPGHGSRFQIVREESLRTVKSPTV